MNASTVEDVFELSPVQQGMLFHSLLHPDSDLYRVILLYSITGDLKPDLFIQSWQQIIREHDALRTTFHWTDLEKPLQAVHAEATLPFEMIDIRTAAASQQAVQWEAVVASARRWPLSLDRAPLLHAALVRYDQDSYRFVLACHHLLLDGWSAALLVERASVIYTALARGEPPLVQLTPPFRSYIAWLQRQESVAAERFWRRELAGVTGPTGLGTGHAQGVGGAQRHAVERMVLPSARLRAAAKRHSITLNTLVQGAWALLLRCYSGQRDVLFGATVSGRPVELAGVESIVGLFINTIPIRVTVDTTPAGSWLAALQAHQAEVRQHGYISLVEIQGWSSIPRDVPMFETLVAFENFPARRALAQPRLGDVELTRIGVTQQTNYAITVCVEDDGDELYGSILYDAERFEAAAAQAMLCHFRTALEQLADGSDHPVDEISILTPQERRHLLVELNDTATPYPPCCLHQLFEVEVDKNPDNIAVVHARARLTYGQLNERANRLAHHLRALGVAPEVRVAVAIERSPDMVAVLLGVLKAGGCYVPLDAAYPTQRLELMVKESQASLLITRTGWLREPLSVRTTYVDSPIDECSCCDPPQQATGQNAAYVLFTSGSTGSPKGVVIEHHSATNLICWARDTFGDDLARVLASTSICFDCSIFELFAPLASGGAVVLVDNLLELATSSTEEEITLINSVPSVVTTLLRVARLPQSVRTVNLGGEPPDARLIHELYSNPNVLRVVNGYGPTECTTYATHSVLKRGVRGRASIGRPLANTSLYILDDRREPVPVGVTGELWIGGEGVVRGYLQAEPTREKFIDNPFGDGRLYRTGDLARYAEDGTVEFLGRADEQVKVRGFRIELGEVEAALKAHGSVRRAVVVVHESAEGERDLVAFVTGDAIQPTQLRAWLREKLPAPFVPSRIEVLEELPLLPNGKVDRRALPAPERNLRHTGAESARDAIEVQLVALWEDILGVSPIGATDDFFELGGHSLSAVRLMARLPKYFGRKLPLATVLRAPTIREQAAALRSSGEMLSSPLVAIRLNGDKHPLYFMPPSDGGVLGYAELMRHLDHDRPLYALSAPGLDGEDKPLSSIEEMAFRYVSAIRSVQPRGPYLLAGWSLGGVVAFEAAQQLQRGGQQVAGLVLIDTWAPHFSRVPEALDESRLMAVVPRGAEGWFGDLLARTRELPGSDLRQRFDLALKTLGLPDGLDEVVAQLERIASAYQAGIEALRQYIPRHFPGSLLVVSAAERLTGALTDPTLGWKSLATQVETTITPGNHYTMMREPQVKTLGGHLRDYFGRRR